MAVEWREERRRAGFAAGQETLTRAAEVLEIGAPAIVGRWLRRLREVCPSLPATLSPQEMMDNTPDVVAGVAQALRLGQAEVRAAPWTRAAHEHAQLRLRQGEELGDLVREYEVLREEMWTELAARPVSEKAHEVYGLARDLGAALDTMVAIATGDYGAELQRALAAAEAGRLATAHLAAFVESSEDAIATTDTQRIVQEWNPAAEQLYGYTAREMVGGSLMRLVPPDLVDEAARIFARAVSGAPTRRFDTVRLRKDGTRIAVSVAVAPIRDPAGRVNSVSWVSHDVGERVRAQEELRQANRTLRVYERIFENMPDPLLLVNRSFVIQRANPAYANFLQRPTQQVVGRPLAEILGRDTFERLARPMLEHAFAGEARDWEAWIDYPRLGSRYVQVRYLPLADGSRSESVGVLLRDLTEGKRAEEALRRSEQRYRLLFETMLQGVVYQDASGTIISMNPAAERILGKSPADFLGQSSVSMEHDTIRPDGTAFPGVQHPAMVALRTG